jgi:hypothetical protein
MVPAALRTAGMPSCPVPGLPFGSSALCASGTKRSTCRTPAITGFLRAVITENLPVNSAFGALEFMIRQLTLKIVNGVEQSEIPVTIFNVNMQTFSS